MRRFPGRLVGLAHEALSVLLWATPLMDPGGFQVFLIKTKSWEASLSSKL